MKEFIDYLNQSGITGLVLTYMIVGGILFIIVFIVTIWMVIKISRRVFNNRNTSMLNYQRRKRRMEKEL